MQTNEPVLLDRKKSPPTILQWAFTKKQMLLPAAGMPDVGYDPFPDKNMDENVHTIEVGREIVWEGSFKDASCILKPGHKLNDGELYVIERVTHKLDEGTATVMARYSHKPDFDPVDLLRQARKMFADRGRAGLN